MSMTLRDGHGWPVVTIKGRPITNVIRKIIHTDIFTTLKYIKKEKKKEIKTHEGRQ